MCSWVIDVIQSIFTARFAGEDNFVPPITRSLGSDIYRIWGGKVR